MLDEILQWARSSEYDFRKTANPNDPLAERFPEWLDYYRMKWAICRVLSPGSILEIGVRYGYSAVAFLDACPSASYLGIDLDSNRFGGVPGAILWAREITRRYATRFVVADTQQMDRLPGGIYELIHVDGQQDGDGSFHDLELAIRQGKWVLADGFFWTQTNFLALNDFLYRYRDVFDFYAVIPGYAGELLIKPSPHFLEETQPRPAQTTSSADIRHTYISSYYLNDCGGFDSFRKGEGRVLEDARLRAVASIAGLKTSGRVLDLGCGRGELAYYFAQQGFCVTAVDYSLDAITLAKRCIGDGACGDRVDLICSDVCSVPIVGEYDLVIASDVIEHLSPEELDLLYAKVVRHLKRDGLFVVHTYPNLWMFKYDYPRRRKIASSVGSYLPFQPRTRYEMLMHINEQSPRVLRRSLREHFEDVILWFCEPSQPGGNLLRKFYMHELCGARDLFAVASRSSISCAALKQQLEMRPLPEHGLDKLGLRIETSPSRVAASAEFEIEVDLINGGSYPVSSYEPNPVHICYHWLGKGGNSVIVFDGQRSAITPTLSAGTHRRMSAQIKAPEHAGICVLRMTLVQEFVRWFDWPPVSLFSDKEIYIGDAK